MKKIAAEISNLINRLTGFAVIHAKSSEIKGDYSAGKKDYYNNDYNGKFNNKL
jgi:hypothetical protein